MEFERRRRIEGGINLVPLINVVFLLLIFFMLAGTLRSPAPFGLELPRSASGAAAERQPLEIILGRFGELALDGAPVEADALGPALESRFGDKPRFGVVLKADARAESGTMVDLLDELRAAGAGTIFLSTLPPPPP